MPSASNTERARKFLVRALPPDLRRHPHHRIRQGYLVIDPAGPEARLRHITRGRRQEFVLTVKHPTDDPSARTEIEITITRAQFERLWPLTRTQRLEKTRYEVSHGRHTIEVDVYHGPLKGLAVAEVEFATETRLGSFVPPPWLSRDISENKVYGNKSLARRGLPKSVKPR